MSGPMSETASRARRGYAGIAALGMPTAGASGNLNPNLARAGTWVAGDPVLRAPFTKKGAPRAMSSILITGASKGIGRATAAELARRGHRVVATARDPRTLDDLDVDQRLRVDATDQARVDAAIAQAGEIDVLISNAGAIFAAAVEASPTAEIERLYAQNTVGTIRVTQAVLPQMRKRHKGRLLFVSSIAGRTRFP
jgi:NADP-dependent 3-hydroxy acid dehydrogenase YdfG